MDNSNSIIVDSTYEMCCIFQKNDKNENKNENIDEEKLLLDVTLNSNRSDRSSRSSSNSSSNGIQEQRSSNSGIDNDKYQKLLDEKGLASIRLHKYYYGKINEAMKEAKELSAQRYAKILNSQKYDFEGSPQNTITRSIRNVVAVDARNARTIYPSSGVQNQIHDPRIQ